MALAAQEAIGDRLLQGVVVAPSLADVPAPLRAIAGQHPQPGEGSEQGGREALALAREAREPTRLLVMLSGGASSLMAVPATGLTLEDKRRATAVLLRSGADIVALNTVRKHLSAIKGGWLAASAAAPCLALVLSDVVGDDPSVIASGPTVGDATTFQDAFDVLQQYGDLEAYPRAVVDRLSRGAAGACAETPKPDDPRLARSTVSIIGGRNDAMRGVTEAAHRKGYTVLTVDAPVVGEARDAAKAHVRDVLARARHLPRPLCVVSSGETTVAVKGTGRGGRNQEFALAAAGILHDDRADAMLASVGTDGVDGPTDAAGAVADASTASRAEAIGLRPMNTYLDTNNAYAFFDALGDLIHTGPTGTNVGDLQIFLLA
jgi:hydroxypyruvate reductase